MSQEAVPEPTVPQQPAPQPATERKGAPKGLLQQMEELMTALSADLTQLDADLQPTSDRTPPTGDPDERQQAHGTEEREQREHD